MDIPEDFESDGCTCVPDLNLSDCCRQHDYDYYSEKHCYRNRKEADKRMYRCVKSKGRPFIAILYYLGLRLFGWLFFYTHSTKIKEFREKYNLD
jgi:hypothetical protein